MIDDKVNMSKNAAKNYSELQELFKVANSTTDVAKKSALVNEAVEKLVPNARSTFGAVSGASKTVTGNVGDHLKVMQAGGVNSGDSDYADGNVWLRMNYLQQTVDAQDAAPGYKQKSMGFGIGVDQPLNDKFTMGLAYNFVRSDVDGEDGYLREDDVKSHGFGGYVTMMHDNLFADAQINYVKNKVDGFRKVTSESTKITYKYDADVLNAMIGLGMHVDLENHWYAKPKLCFAFANHKTDKYNEEGSTLVSTDIDAASHQSSEVGLQLTVGADLMMDNYKVMPKLNMGFMYDMNDKKDKVTFTFMGDDSFVAEGPKRDRSNFNLGVGAGFMMENVTLSLDYGFNWSSNTKTHGISAKLGCMF
jgi:outer membrane autotransporter protein